MATAALPPAFIAAPSHADAAAAYPAAAAGQKLAGHATLRCTPRPDGYLARCATVDETPKGYGFAGAARTLAAKLRVTPGQGRDVRVTLGFTPDLLVGGAGVVRGPQWLALPTAEDFQATVPKTENGIMDARVVLDCIVSPEGGLSDCRVESEAPAGQGYGEGALALSAKFKLAPIGADGVPTAGAHIHLPIRYAMTPAAKP